MRARPVHSQLVERLPYIPAAAGVHFHEVGPGGSSAQRLNAEGTRARIKVQDARSFNGVPANNRKDRRAYPLGGGPQANRPGRAEPTASLTAAGDSCTHSQSHRRVGRAGITNSVGILTWPDAPLKQSFVHYFGKEIVFVLVFSDEGRHDAWRPRAFDALVNLTPG